MGAVVARATEPALGAIKLAWWREELEKLDAGPPPPEPRLQAAATELLPKGISGHELAGLQTGWGTLLDEHPDAGLVAGRGEILFGLAARLLDADHDNLPAAGRLYALMSATRLGLRDFRSAADAPPAARFPPKLRPLTGLASLARRDLLRDSMEPEATPGRSWALMRHWMTGKI